MNIHALVDDFGDNEPYEITLFNVSAVWPDTDTDRIGIHCDNVNFYVTYPDKAERNKAYRRFNSAVSGGAGYYDFMEGTNGGEDDA